jgi:hypothetical protein
MRIGHAEVYGRFGLGHKMNACFCITRADKVGLDCGAPQNALFFRSPPVGMRDDEISRINKIQPYVLSIRCPISKKGSSVGQEISEEVGIYPLHSQMERKSWQKFDYRGWGSDTDNGTHCRSADCVSA